MISLTNFYFMLVNNLCKKGKKEKAFVKVNKSLVFFKEKYTSSETIFVKKNSFFFIQFEEKGIF